MRDVRAVLWDMDGTLIDSAEFHWISWRDTMQKEGVPIRHEQFLATFGQRNDSILQQWLGAAATPERIERIGSAKEQEYRELVRKHGMKPLPGVAVWLKRLHESGWLQAIGSAAPRENIEVVLEAVSATHLFQAIVSAEDVHHGKPDPEVYLIAASRLGAPPARSIVVEDAVAGVEAARRAGMHSVGVSRNGKHLPADIVVQSLDQLPANAFEALLLLTRLPENH
ncbi:MAG: HAD-IA family hydrolase [Acidobacteriaceae bacterium]|nr:HAD-IA family hydrolase [Acidobacteriaceae bacterium]